MADDKHNETRQKWDAIYRESACGQHEAARVLTENGHLLPTQGRALEIASGRAANALLLARHGLEVDAWDISAVAIAQVNELAVREGLAVHGAVRDVVSEPPAADSYDVIVISHFLDMTADRDQRGAVLNPEIVLFPRACERP